jgi:peptide-methionine (S)-S-oxide reductase
MSRILQVWMVLSLSSCASQAIRAEDTPKPKLDVAAVPVKEGGAISTKSGQEQIAVFAGGCFWCTEAVFEPLRGVSSVVSGYAGDTKETATYEQVGSGDTKHAESIQIIYDPTKISYGDLLHVYFGIIDPTTKDRQGPDAGTQYRSTIFYLNEEQKQVTEAYIKQLTDDKVFSAPIVTTLEPIGLGFFPAEEYHQDFVARHPNHPYVQAWSVPKIEKLNKKFKDLLK